MSLIKISVASLVFIWLVHYLFVFLKTTLTVPISKDMVGYPMQKYQRMFDAINDNNTTKNNINADADAGTPGSNGTLIENLPIDIDTPNIDMRSELKTFLRGNLSTTIPNTNTYGNECNA